MRWTAPASADLEGILDYISEDAPQNALAVLQRIRNAAAGLERIPQRGRSLPELRRQGIVVYRELIVSPWRILYRIVRRTVIVLAVVDGRRRIEDILLDRLTRR